jgi:polyhydroxybutyrate depolymerase
MSHHMLARAIAAILLVIFATDCRRRSMEPAPASSAVPPASASSAPNEVTELEAELHLPRAAKGGPAPLLVLLHGLGSSGEQLASGSDWPSFAEQHGIAWVAPNGPLDAHGRRFWDAGPTCCNFDQPRVDHVAALSALIARLKRAPGIDPERVFVGGHSNGAFMAHRLACERPEVVRGVVAIAGTGPANHAACRKPGSLRVLQLHGDRDPIVPYGGGHLFGNPALPEHVSARQTAGDWATALGCRPEPSPAPALDLDARLPGPETRVEAFGDCKAGAVELWTVAGGDHYLGFRAPVPEAVWAFLSR